MRFRSLKHLLAFLITSAAFAADIGIEFSGVLTADGKTRVALTDKATNTTRWLEAGDIFNGYTIARYDAKEDAIFLRKETEEVRLGLEPSKTPDASRTSPTPVLSATPSRTPNPASAPPPVAPPVTPNAAAIAQTTPPPTSTPPPVAPPADNGAVSASGPISPAAPSPLTANTPPTSADAATAVATPTNQNAPAATPAPEPPLQPTGRQPPSPTYVIQGGDTLDSIALTQGVSVQQIRQLNPILHSTSLRAGDTIRIR